MEVSICCWALMNERYYFVQEFESDQDPTAKTLIRWLASNGYIRARAHCENVAKSTVDLNAFFYIAYERMTAKGPLCERIEPLDDILPLTLHEEFHLGTLRYHLILVRRYLHHRQLVKCIFMMFWQEKSLITLNLWQWNSTPNSRNIWEYQQQASTRKTYTSKNALDINLYPPSLMGIYLGLDAISKFPHNWKATFRAVDPKEKRYAVTPWTKIASTSLSPRSSQIEGRRRQSKSQSKDYLLFLGRMETRWCLHSKNL